ncbi:CoA ester lyase [Haloechinothrix salitolerans]
MFGKAAASGADVVFLDLEDAVVPAAKEDARDEAVEALTGRDWGNTERAVRINGLDTPWAHDDIIETVTGAREAMDTLIVPKVTAARDVWWVDVLLTQVEKKLGLAERIRVQAVIETVEGLINVEAIAKASPRLTAISFGAGDYSLSQGARVGANLESTIPYPGDIWQYARSKILVAARAAGVAAIDSAYPDYRDHAGFEQAAQRAAVLGFSGKLVIHPSQVIIANRVFSPSKKEIDLARRHLASVEQGEAAGQGAVSLDGVLVDAFHLRWARQILARVSGAS